MNNKERIDLNSQVEQLGLDGLDVIAEKQFRFKKDMLTIRGALTILILLSCFFAFVALDKDSPDSMRSWAQTSLTAVLSGCAGYVFGQSGGDS